MIKAITMEKHAPKDSQSDREFNISYAIEVFYSPIHALLTNDLEPTREADLGKSFSSHEVSPMRIFGDICRGLIVARMMEDRPLLAEPRH